MKLSKLKKGRIYLVEYGEGKIEFKDFAKFLRKKSKGVYSFLWYDDHAECDELAQQIFKIRKATKQEINELAADEL